MPFKRMDESVRGLGTKVDLLKKESKAKRDDSSFLHLNLAGFGFFGFALGTLEWQAYGSSHRITVLVLIVAALVLIAFNIYLMFRSPVAKKKEKQD